jgi:putative transposase
LIQVAAHVKSTNRKFHGGRHARGKRKTARPLDTKKPLHLVLYSEVAKGALSLRHPSNKKMVDNIVYRYAEQNQIKIYDYSNSGSHLHMSLKTSSRQSFQRFLRTITGLIARAILKAKRNAPKGRFWSTLAFTRVADWGKAFIELKKYIFRNVLEASGAIPYDRENLKWKKIDST